MGFAPGGIALIVLAYAFPVAVVGVVFYLVLRFAIRDGLRGHRLWLERTDRIADPLAGDADPS